MTTIEDLPFPVLEHILSKVDRKGVLNICDASLKCDYVVRKSLNSSLYVDIGEKLDVLNSRSRPRYFWVDIGGNKSLMHIEALKTFAWFGSISSAQAFNTLTQALTNLRELELGWIIMALGEEPLAWIYFPELKKLTLGGPGKTDRVEAREYSNQYRVHRNIDGLIAFMKRISFPKLELLSIGAICHSGRTNRLADSMLQFLSAHEKTLQGLSILLVHVSLVYAYRGEDPNQLMTRDFHVVPDWDIRLSNLSLNLKNVLFHCVHLEEFEKMTQLAQHISTFPSSVSMESSVMLFPKFYKSFPVELVEKNFKTLTILAINVATFPEKLDCKMFENCVLLKKFLLSTPTSTDAEGQQLEIPAKPELVNIAYLPRTLEFFHLVNFIIETKESELLASEFPLLETLILQGIGEEGSLGFKFQDFLSLLRRGWKEVGIDRGFNKASVQEALTSDDGGTLFATLSLMDNQFLRSNSHIWSLSVSKHGRGNSLVSEFRRGTSLRQELFPDCLRVTTWFKDSGA